MSRGYSCAHPWNGEWSHTTRLSVNIGNLLIIVIRFEKQRDHDRGKKASVEVMPFYSTLYTG